MDGSNKDVDLDNISAGDDKNEVNLPNVYTDSGDSNDDGGVDDLTWNDTNGADDANCSDADSKFVFGDDVDSGNGDDSDNHKTLTLTLQS